MKTRHRRRTSRQTPGGGARTQAQRTAGDSWPGDGAGGVGRSLVCGDGVRRVSQRGSRSAVGADPRPARCRHRSFAMANTWHWQSPGRRSLRGDARASWLLKMRAPTWRAVPLPAGLTALVTLSLAPDGSLWAGGREGVFYSENGGESWAPLRRLPVVAVNRIAWNSNAGAADRYFRRGDRDLCDRSA